MRAAIRGVPRRGSIADPALAVIGAVIGCATAVCGLAAPIAAQTLRVGDEAFVYADPSGRPLVEPHLSVSPTTPDHLLLGVIASAADMSANDCVILAAGDVELLVYRSADGGRSWPDPPVSLGGGHDHQTIAVDRTGGPRHATIYVASARDVRRPEPEGYGPACTSLARRTAGGRSRTRSSIRSGWP